MSTRHFQSPRRFTLNIDDILTASTPSTLEHRINHLRTLIAKGCGTPSLVAMLAEFEKAQRLIDANFEQVDKLRRGLGVIAKAGNPYPADLFQPRRAAFLAAIRERNQGAS
jgi:hypothetical protein